MPIFKNKCECGRDLKLEKDVGWDIDDECNEQRQHIQTCEFCKKDRLVTECYSHEKGIFELFYGQFTKKGIGCFQK